MMGVLLERTPAPLRLLMKGSASDAEKYLVDDAGKPVYYVDPGINGTIRELPGGKKVEKFDAPKATLMSYIIKGILGGELPWGLVLLGVMIAIVLELSGIPSLAFAVGVYLPLSSSSTTLSTSLSSGPVVRSTSLIRRPMPLSIEPPEVRRTSTIRCEAPLFVRSAIRALTWSTTFGPNAAMRT